MQSIEGIYKDRFINSLLDRTYKKKNIGLLYRPKEVSLYANGVDGHGTFTLNNYYGQQLCNHLTDFHSFACFTSNKSFMFV